MIKRFLITLLFLSFASGFAQEYSKLYHTYKAKYPEARQVILESHTDVSITIVDGELEIYQEVFEDILLLTSPSSYTVKESVTTSSFFELGKIEASTLVYKNGKYRPIKVEQFNEKENSGSSFYDDTKLLTFKYPSLAEGARKTLRYKEKIKNPRFLNSVLFASNHPIESKVYTLKVDKEVKLNFKKYNLEEVNITHTEKKSKGAILHQWKATGIEGLKLESGTPNIRYFIPHMIPIIESYTNDNKEIVLTKSPDDLYNWYYSLVKDINQESPSQEMVDLVNEITKGKDQNIDKVKAIYYWVQENIKYIAFEYALGGFVPREANNVFTKKYGDCKDNSSILFEMLKIAGLEGNLTWIGTRDVPYSYNELPTPAVDNHMILSYTEDDKTYYLDATGRYLAIDLPSAFIQGKEALIGKGEGNFEIKKVPIVSETKNKIIESTKLRLNKDLDLEGQGILTLSGYPKIDAFFNLERIKTKEQHTDFYKNSLQKGSNNFIIKDFKESNKYSYEKPLIVDYNFEINNYVQHFENEVYINLNLNTDLLNFKSQSERTYDREFEYKATLAYSNILEIPDNMQLDYIPENFSVNNPLFDIKINYEKKEDSLIYTLEILQKFILITPSQQTTLDQLLDKIQQQFKEVVVLKQNK